MSASHSVLVTVLAEYLGAGKVTLLDRILSGETRSSHATGRIRPECRAWKGMARRDQQALLARLGKRETI